jgi:uracil-DNA glycosylase
MKQIVQLHKKFDELQKRYGEPSLSSIYGAGCIENPKVMFVFMNPTGRNVASEPSWEGLKAPWIGTKQVWDVFYNLGFLNEDTYKSIKEYKSENWSVEFCNKVYSEVEENSLYITNLAKCTQLDARPLRNSVFRDYLDLMLKEIEIVNPKIVISFGNQVSSILLGKNISVSNYTQDEKEIVNGYSIYPTYYPVGQGRRNMPLALERIKTVLNI